MNQDELRRRYNAAIQANPSLRGAVTPEAARRQQGLDLPKLKTPKSNPLEAFVDGAANFGKDVVSSVQQAGGNVADIGVQGNALKDYALNTLNPFIDQQTRQKNEQDIAARSEAQRAVYHNMTDVSGNKLIGSSDVDEAGGRIAAGRGTLQDYAAVAGKGLQTGLDATMFFNPTRVGAKAIIENPGAKEVAKDLLISSGAIGGTQGAATGAQVYGQTGDAGQAAAEGAKSAAATTLLQSLLGGAAHGIGTLINKTQGPARTIARSKDPGGIDNTLAQLHPELDVDTRKVLAEQLSQIKDTKTVRAILDDMAQSSEEIPVAKAIERGVADEALPTPEQVADINAQKALADAPTEAMADLMSEARKYKSADEFIKAQGEPLYHGSPNHEVIRKDGFKTNPNGNNLLGEGVYLTRHRSKAENYSYPMDLADRTTITQEGRSAGVVDAYIPKGTKIFQPESRAELKNLTTKDLQNKGYGGVEVNGETVIFDSAKIKTKEQLTDLYNQAHTETKTPTPQAPKPEAPQPQAPKATADPTAAPETAPKIPSYIPEDRIDEYLKSADYQRDSGFDRMASETKSGDPFDHPDMYENPTPEMYNNLKVPKTAAEAPKATADPTAALKQEAIPKYMQDKVTPEGYFTEGRYKDGAYPKNFVAKADIPHTNIKAGDRVALIKYKDGRFDAILSKKYKEKSTGYTISRESYVDPESFTQSQPPKSTPQAPQPEAPAQVAGDGSTASNAPQNNPPNQTNTNTTKTPKTSKTPQNTPTNNNSRETINKVFVGDDEFDRGTPLIDRNAKEGDLIDALSELKSVPANERSLTDTQRIKNIEAALKERREKGTISDEAWDAETQRHIDQLNENKGKLKDQDKARKQETGARAAAGEAAYKAAGGGEAGMRAKMAAQKGEKTKANIEPVEASDEYKNTILNDIEGSDKQFWEKTNTQNAFRKMWGDLDKPMQNHDIKKIQDYYNSKKEGLGDDVAELLHENKGTQEDFNLIEQIAGAPRTAMTIADFSAPRQMAVAFARHPLVTSRNYLKSFAQTFSQKKFDASTEEMANAVDQNGKNYSEFMDSVMNLHLPNVAEKASEEAMSSAQLLTKVPFYGRVVDASNRGMSSALAHTRFELAKNFIDAAGGIDNVIKTFSTKELADLGEVLNTITGRGGKKGGFVDRNAGVLSNTLFSGRLWASRLNMLNPYWYTRLSGPARKEALSSLVAFSALLGGTLSAIAATGVEVGTDPRSADFGKVKIGNTRYDISGGFVQYPRLLSQMISGQKVSSTSGAERDVTAGEILGGFAEGKLNPLLAFAWTIANTLPGDDGNPLMRKDEFGEDVNIAQKGAEMSMPLNVSGMIETSNDVGDPILGVLMNVPSFFGAGVQTYGTTPSNLAGQTASATGLDVEKEVAKREADATKRKEQYKKTLSKEDKQLIGKSETELNRLKKDGIIDQNKVDDILRKNKTLESVGKNNQYDVPEGITTDLSKQVYQKFNSMAKKDQDYWLSDKNPPEEFAKEITKKMNDERVAGLSEFKPSNALAKLYADYEKDLATTKDLSEIDKVNKWKTFQSSAAKLNLSAGAKDVYTEGSSGDLKKLIESKSLSDKDLQDAIQLDNELYSSGLSGSLKFSKKFRNTYGFGIPSGPDDGGSGGSGKSKSAHLDAFIPNSKMGNTGTSGLPRVSAKARTTAKIGAKSLPKASNNVKKISINL